MEKKIKVAIYSGIVPSTTFIENLIKGLSKSGLEIYIFGKKRSSSIKYKPNVKYVLVPNKRLNKVGFVLSQAIFLVIKNPNRFLKLMSYYKSNLEAHHGNKINWWIKILPVVNNLPDIFHIQWAKSLEEWIFLKEIFDIKIVLSLRGSHITYSPLSNESLAKSYIALFPKVDCFHAVSQSIAAKAIKYLSIKKDIKVIYTAADIEKLDQFKRRNRNINKEFRFLSVGRYHWIKGYQYALTALKYLLDDGYKCDYTIIAEGKPSEEILYLTNYFDLKKHVNFIECNHQQEVYQHMKISDGLLLPSVEEGIANVVIEAMFIGLPVISSDLPGMREIIADESNAMLFQNRNSKDLKFKMKKIIELKKEEKDKIVRNARRSIKKNHSLDRLSIKMKELYTNLI